MVGGGVLLAQLFRAPDAGLASEAPRVGCCCGSELSRLLSAPWFHTGWVVEAGGSAGDTDGTPGPKLQPGPSLVFVTFWEVETVILFVQNCLRNN